MSDLITFEPSTQITFHTGDCLSVMRSLPDACVDCCITSPPYYNLRDYRHAGQIGCEEHLEDYISRLVEVFSEVKRLLKPCGTIWLVLGDCYLNKNRLLVPAQVALALRDRCGLILRDEIIYSKPRTTPSPVKDRTAAAHEFVYMFSKSPTYYYDYLAIEEASKYAGAIKTYSAGKQKNVGNVTKAPGSVPRTIVVRATRRKRSVWSISPEPFRGAHTACVDAETECLTQTGWKTQDNLLEGDMAAQFDIESQKLSWGKIEQVNRYDVENEQMLHLKTQTLEMTVTLNHRVVVKKRRGSDTNLHIIPASEMKLSDCIPVAGVWNEADAGINPISDDWAELLGWYIAEGCETKHSWTVEIYQSMSANPIKVARIRDLLNNVGAKYLEASFSRLWFNRPSVCVTFQIQGFAAARLRKLAPGKSLPHDVLLWSRSLLERLMTGLIDGDGHVRNNGRMTFMQKSSPIIDMVQAIAVRLGMAVQKSFYKDSGCSVLYLSEKKFVSMRGANDAGQSTMLERLDYTGIVWCPSLPMGTWVARKNGRAFITGNSFPTKLVIPCVLAGCPGQGTVLDPFAGSGTTGLVARSLDRRSVLIELNPDYVAMAKRRLEL